MASGPGLSEIVAALGPSIRESVVQAVTQQAALHASLQVPYISDDVSCHHCAMCSFGI